VVKIIILGLLALPLLASAESRVDRFEIEGGVVATRNMAIHGFNQANATEGWRQTAPDVRLEYWRVKDKDWNYGVVYQPLIAQYQDVLKSNLNYKGQVFTAGSPATLDYRFPTLRVTGNTPVYQSNEGTEVRAGGSLIVRYANVSLSAGGKSFADNNLIAIPVFNLEAKRSIGSGYSFFTRSDFLPGIDGNVFLDGLYDVFLGIRKRLDHGDDLDVGIRLFFGGYDPKKQDDYANRIFFNALVVRYNF
jgi:hypothetical protein